MNTKKIIKKLFIIIAIVLIAVLCKFIYNSEAASKIDYVTMAHKGYDVVSKMSYGEIMSYTLEDDGNHLWEGCHQVMCLHGSNTANKPTAKADIIIDINPDGTNPKGGKIFIDGTEKTLPKDDKNAILAYMAYFAENRSDSEGAVYGTVKNPFSYFWQYESYRNYLSKFSTNLPNTTEDFSELSKSANKIVLKEARQYAQNCTKSEKTYSARIIIFKGGEEQTRAILYGSEAPGGGIPTINKYITSVKAPDGSVTSFSRNDYSESQKLANAVYVQSGATVTYRIELLGSGNTEYSITDTFDSSALEFNSSSKLQNIGGKLIGKLKPGQSCTVTLTVKSVKSSATKYYNTAKIDELALESSDYIRISYTETSTEEEGGPPSGNYKKYIIKHNGNSVSDRSEYDNAEAKQNPITVKKGDTVTYRLEVENTSSVNIDNLTVTDTMESGLSYNGGNSLTHNFGTVEQGKKVTYDFTVKVTKSDMYLLPIENSFKITSGTYQKLHRITIVRINTITLSDGTIITVPSTDITEWYTTENISPSWFTSNANKDYVQLDDVEIAGDVWLDANKDGIKSGESALSGIKVYLYKNGTQVGSTVTDANGHYTFGLREKGNIPYEGGTRKYADNSGYNNYYVKFEYFGVDYESTVYTNEVGVTDSGTTDNWNNKSHACENNISSTNRQDFNNTFETIAYNTAYKGITGSEASKKLEYAKANHSSILNWTDTTTIAAQSMNLFVKVVGGDTECADNIEYLKHINLGLIRRETADLEISKDVYKADVTVNGYKTTYTYDSLGKNGFKKVDYNKINTPYKLKIYNEDYKFRTAKFGDKLADIKEKENPYTQYGNDNDLNIIITYKITVTNTSANAKDAVIREILDYSSNEMTIKEARMGVVDGTSLITSTTSNYNKESIYTYSGYNTTFISGDALNTKLSKGSSLDLYVTYKVNKNDDAIIIDKDTGDLGKINIAEIAAFSIYNIGTTTPAGLVDTDSNPANINTSIISNLSETSLYEDDTFQTSICVVLRDGETSIKSNRQIKGNVWEDLNTEILSESEQKVGNGIKDTTESGVKSKNRVRVKLMEVIRSSKETSDINEDEEYLVDTGIETTTDDSGNYVLESNDRLHSGQYVVRFIYGSEKDKLTTNNNGDTIKYSGQDYKSTTYKEIGTVDNEDEVLEANAFSSTANGKIYSFAKDNELRRLEVISYSTQMTYPLDNILKSTKTTGDLTTLAENTAMYADTKKFNLQLEYVDYYSDFTAKEYNGLKVNNYQVNKVDFGLLERPKTKLNLMNDITEIIAQTSDGNELIHLYFDISYTKDKNSSNVNHNAHLNTVKSVGFENVQVLNRTYYATQGFRYVNIDSELLQGMTITLKFQIGIANNSDIDTSNQNLIDMVKDYKLDEVITMLKEETKFAGNQVYRYAVNSNSELSMIEKQMISSYSYLDLSNAISKMKKEYPEYKTVINGTSKNLDYELGYFLGKTYYKGECDITKDVNVETRVDQIIDYVDTDLVFNPANNINSKGELKFISYSIEEIANKQLLKDVNEDSVITDGKSYYIVGTLNSTNAIIDGLFTPEYRNNLAFNIEDEDINGGLYKYLKALLPSEDLSGKNDNDDIELDDLYIIDLEASRTLTSEADLEGVAIDNIAEIIKVSNTVGRKVYVINSDTDSENVTGYIGNSTEKIARVNGPDGYNIMAVAKETDSDFTEYTTFSPPTGLSQKAIKTNKTIDTTIVIIALIVIVIGSVYVVIKFATRKRIYK